MTPERQNQPLEQESIHERGGLTPEYWERILSAVSIVDKYWEKDAKEIRAYASSVISGDIQDINFVHREHLGSRHWDLIKRTVLKNQFDFDEFSLSSRLKRLFNKNLRKDLEDDKDILLEW